MYNKKIVSIIISFIIIISISANTSLEVNAWWENTHKSIFELSLDILKNDKGTTYYNFFNNYYSTIYNATIEPDYDPLESGTGLHYYNIRNQNDLL